MLAQICENATNFVHKEVAKPSRQGLGLGLGLGLSLGLDQTSAVTVHEQSRQRVELEPK